MTDDLFGNAVKELVGHEPGEFEVPDFSQLALSQFGDLELNKALYENRLQNIFNEYDKNIATLAQKEQQSLQDAYYVREMSRKYLGEYASNTGINDVSGNLMDIYSNYQQNITGINEHYDELSLNLSKEYQGERMKVFEDIMTNNYNIEVAKLDVGVQQMWADIAMNRTGNLSDFEYIDQQVENGLFDNLQADQYKIMLSEANAEMANNNLVNGYYGYSTNEEGEMVLNTTAEQYVESLKDQILPEQYKDMLSRAKLIDQANTPPVPAEELDDTLNQPWVSDGYETVANPNYVGEDYNYEIMVPGANVDRSSIGVLMGDTVYWVTNSPLGLDTDWDVDPDELETAYATMVEREGLDPETPKENGDIVQVTAYNNKTESPVQTNYYWHNNQWYRMEAEANVEGQMYFWYSDDGEDVEGNNFKLEDNRRNRFTYHGTEYVMNRGPSNQYQDDSDIVAKFREVHPADNDWGFRGTAVIYYQGDFYGSTNDGQIFKYKKA